MELVVDSVEALRTLHEPGRRAMLRRVRLAGPLTDAVLENRLNSAYFACGCDTGSVAVGLTIIVCLVGGIATRLDGTFGPWHIVGYLAGAALIGKGVGLIAARIRLIHIERRLRARLVTAGAATSGLRAS
jgi:hypothetical protein